MIAKISSTENLGGALGYNFKKVEKGEASILLAAELYQDKEGRYTKEDVLADMEALIPKNCRTKKTVFHCSLNPHPDEKLSDERLTQIAKEYMEALGYGNQPYIVFKHNDICSLIFLWVVSILGVSFIALSVTFELGMRLNFLSKVSVIFLLRRFSNLSLIF